MGEQKLSYQEYVKKHEEARRAYVAKLGVEYEDYYRKAPSAREKKAEDEEQQVVRDLTDTAYETDEEQIPAEEDAEIVESAEEEYSDEDDDENIPLEGLSRLFHGIGRKLGFGKEEEDETAEETEEAYEETEEYEEPEEYEETEEAEESEETEEDETQEDEEQ